MRISVLNGWRGVTLIALTYVYFLIFAQFAFLSRLAELGAAGASLKIVLAAMAVGGVLAGLLAPGLAPIASQATGVRIGFALCGVAALASLLPLNIAAAACDASLIGVGVGLLTVTLVDASARLDRHRPRAGEGWTRRRSRLLRLQRAVAVCGHT